MSIFSGFNQLNNTISRATGSVRQTSQTINSFTANINRAASQFSRLGESANRVTGEVADTVRNVSNAANSVGSLINAGGASAGNVGTAIRMTGNAAQNVGYNATPPSATAITKATLSSALQAEQGVDWRVSLSIPSTLISNAGEILQPFLGQTGTENKMIFPFNPNILLGHTANYSSIHPAHTNFIMHAYENSQVDNITITGEFYSENEADAKYWIACVHFLRTMTKMFYGSSGDPLGNPPLVSRLNGYGKFVLNNIPVVVTNFTTDLPADVDYIKCVVAGQVNYVPVQSVLTVTVAPNYARRSHARFSLQEYAKGNHVQGPEGFI